MTEYKSRIIEVAIALAVFLFLSIAYMYPALEGKNIMQSDVVQHKGMSKELVDHRNKTGEEAIWTNSMYGGMPGYLISTRYLGNKLSIIHRLLVLGNWRPVCFIFLYLFGFYMALLAFGVNPWLSIAGAIAYAFSSYLFIILEVGHISKVLALGYMPAIIGGVHLAFRGKFLWGSLLTGIALGLQLYVVHMQITYYTMIVILVYGFFEVIHAIKGKVLPHFFKSILFLSIAVVLAVGSNIANLWTTYEYGQFSIRGPSELTYSDEENKTSGLDKDYATQWSYGIDETFTLLIPNFMGGASGSELPEDSETFKLLSQIQGKANARRAIKQMPTYWGDVIFTSGPVYVGAIVCFLFVFGLFVVDKKIRWWLLSATIISFILSWGRHLPGVTNFMLDHLPGYNKFRAVSMTLVIAGVTMPIMAILAFNRIIQKEVDRKTAIKALKYSFGIVAGLLLFLIAFAKGLFSFEALQDEQYLSKGYTDFVDAIQADRLMLMRKDAFRSLIFVSLGAGLVFMVVKEKIKTQYAIAIFGAIMLIDLWPIDKRYLNKDNFVKQKQYENPIVESTADKIILQDPNISHRVLNLTVSPLLDATTSYFHKSIGGYHGAKLRRFQEIYERQIVQDIQNFSQQINKADPRNAFANTGILNMLNTKYIIYNKDAAPIVNPQACGNAWFVKEFEIVPNADVEIDRIGEINTQTTALIDKRFESFVEGKTFNYDSAGSITLDTYKPNYLKYSYNASAEQLVVFSEIFYPKGWIVKIDGNNVQDFRANYILRALVVPAGNHTIEFHFKPKSYFFGEKLSLFSSLLLLGVLLFALIMSFKDLLVANKHSGE